MSVESMSRAVVHQNFPGAGFGVTQIYERVPKEGEDGTDDDIRMGDRTEEGFEGEETCEEVREEDEEESE